MSVWLTCHGKLFQGKTTTKHEHYPSGEDTKRPEGGQREPPQQGAAPETREE